MARVLSVAAPSSWWDDVNSSEDWQRGVFSCLCACYALVSFAALVQLVRIHLRVPEYGWTTQKLFHFMNFIVNALRAILFGFYHSVFLIRPKALEMALLDFPGLLFFSTYTLLVLFWAEIYYQARSLTTEKLRPAYLAINGVVYIIQVIVWVYAGVGSNPIAMEVAKIIFAVFSLIAAIGFVIYGGRLFFMLRRFPIQSRGRQKKMTEVGLVTSICSLCFVARCLMVTISALNKNEDLDVLDHPILNFIYYMITEIIPSTLVLFILRKLPPRRVTDQYHPIS